MKLVLSDSGGVHYGRMTSHCPACLFQSSENLSCVPDHEYGTQAEAYYSVCSDCSSLFQSPMPTSETLAGFYPQTYHSFRSMSLLARCRFWLRLRRFEYLLRDGDSVLDFGCGSGSFLFYASEKCPRVQWLGYEIGRGDAWKSFQQGRVNIFVGDPGRILSELPEVKVVLMNHVIEHLRDPFEVLTHLRDKLSIDGFIEGQTPGAGSLESRLFANRWSGFHSPRHTVIFSPRGLKLTLKRAGFSVKISPGFNPAGVAVSLLSLRNGRSGGQVSRSGLLWIVCLFIGTVFHGVEYLFRSFGMWDFRAVRRAL